MPRVLLLLSSLYLDIDILNHSPRFENTVFDALAISDLPEDHFETALRAHLRSKLDSFRPDKIILHAGRAFQKHPRAVLAALRASQLLEPALQIGCDRSRAVVRRYLEQASADGHPASLADVISEDEALRELIAGIF